MRIRCDKCSAAYTIDDGQLSDEPIGAQCPYCGHVKLVRRGDALSSSADLAADLGFGGRPPPASAPSPGLEVFGPPTSDASAFGGTSLSLHGLISTDLRSTDLRSTDLRSSGARTLDFDGADKAEGEDGSCQVCGAALTEEFAKVIGLCDAHQRERGAAETPGKKSTVESATQWRVRTQDGGELGPLALDGLRQHIRAGSVSVNDRFSRNGGEFGPITRFREIAYLASLAGGEFGSARRVSFVGRRRWPGVGRMVTVVLLVLAVGSIGYLGATQRRRLARLWTSIVHGAATTDTSPGPNPVNRYLDAWRLRHPNVTGTPNEHLVTARSHHLEDSWRGYQAAQNAYERAILLNNDDAEAIAGYVENLALWRFAMSTLEELRVAERAIAYAKALSPDSPAPFRAQAALALAGGKLNGCRAGADGALARDATDGRAKLLLAGCYLEGNAELAIAEATRAKALLPALRRTDRVLAEALSRAGRYATALSTLQARQEADPWNLGVELALGQVELELSRYREAERHFVRAAGLDGDRQAAYLALAELYEERRDYARAATHFAKAARAGAAQGRRASRIYVGWAASEMMRRRFRRALQLVDQALELEDNYAPALLVRGQASLLAGSATTAATYARRLLERRDGEPAALVLLGRSMAALGNRDDAIRHFESAIRNDPRDPKLKGILAAQYLGMGGSPQAYALMRRAGDVDPRDAYARPRVGVMGIRPMAVQEALLQFRKSAAKERNASVASSAMGMLYYHMGDRARAETTVERALRLDGANTIALLYRAQLALDKNDIPRAIAAARKLLAVERGSALGHLLYARALAARRRFDQARDQYRAALRSHPGLLAAEVELAGLDLEGGSRDAAIELLFEKFRVEPGNLMLRRLLLKAGV